MELKLKVIRTTKKYIVVELPRKIFKAKGIPDYVTLKNFDFEY